MPSYNSFGVSGLIQTPSAEIFGESNLHFVLTKNDVYKLGTLTVSPFDWMEASYFYYRPSDLLWAGPETKGLYLDKGFNVKFRYKPRNSSLPEIALGMNDFAGHSLFSREYIVATKSYRNYKFNLGMGWGAFSQQKSYKNPLSFVLGDEYLKRPSIYDERYGVGGNFSYNSWFKGPVGIFGGAEISIPYAKGLKFKIEYDPFNYLDFSCCGGGTSAETPELRRKDSNINYGLSFPVNDENLILNLSYIKGNTLNLSISFGADFSKGFFEKPKYTKRKLKINKKKNEKNSFYVDLLENTKTKSLYIQSAEINDKEKKLELVLINPTYRSHIRSSSYVAAVADALAKEYSFDINEFQITHLNADMELNKITIPAKTLSKPTYTELVRKDIKIETGSIQTYKKHEFQPIVDFPNFFYGWTPALVNHIGSPEKFLFAGLIIRLDTEIQFSRRLMLSTNFAFDVVNNFDGKTSDPGSAMQHVRTEIVNYLQQSDNYIPLMQLDYLLPISNEMYAKFSSGILEKMYGGVGGEFIYKPLNKRYSIGAEYYYVKQRDYDQLFDFQEYETGTGHVNFLYKFNQGILFNFSVGQYLAKDVGYTLDISRRTKSGFRAGFWFTRTNVSAEEFGEGSFDKGFYFQIPTDLFLNRHRPGYTNFRLRPLTRDGGQKLNQGNQLNGMLMNTQRVDFVNQWEDFLD